MEAQRFGASPRAPGAAAVEAPSGPPGTQGRGVTNAGCARSVLLKVIVSLGRPGNVTGEIQGTEDLV